MAWALLLVALLVAAAGGVLIHRGLQEVPRAAPLPATAFSVQPGQLAGSTGSVGSVGVHNGQDPVASAGGASSRPNGPAQVGGGAGVATDATDVPGAAGGSSTPGAGSLVLSSRPQQPAGPLAADHLLVPALGIDAPVTAEDVVGGALTIPGDVSTVGAWTGSAGMSAAAGTVLLAGHIDNIDQGPGALHDLYLLQPGDKVFLQLHGVSSVWQIVTLGTYPKTSIPASLFDGPAGPRRLALVTCGGQIHDGEYDDNVIATAVPA